jgi:uncharacterized protein
LRQDSAIDAHVIIFARFPVPGFVKTRLARGIGNQRASEVYRILAEHVCKETLLSDVFATRHVFAASGEDIPSLRIWLGPEFSYHPQEGEDIGARMANAFHRVFAMGARKVILIGTDIPDFSAVIFEHAANGLNSNDVSIGRSTDGGYYAIAMNEEHAELFDGIKWSSESVFEDTVKKCNEQGLSLSLLPEINDIDEEQDLQQWLRLQPTDSRHPLYRYMKQQQAQNIQTS